MTPERLEEIEACETTLSKSGHPQPFVGELLTAIRELRRQAGIDSVVPAGATAWKDDLGSGRWATPRTVNCTVLDSVRIETVGVGTVTIAASRIVELYEEWKRRAPPPQLPITEQDGLPAIHG
jgi:hypothetical protein